MTEQLEIPQPSQAKKTLEYTKWYCQVVERYYQLHKGSAAVKAINAVNPWVWDELFKKGVSVNETVELLEKGALA